MTIVGCDRLRLQILCAGEDADDGSLRDRREDRGRRTRGRRTVVTRIESFEQSATRRALVSAPLGFVKAEGAGTGRISLEINYGLVICRIGDRGLPVRARNLGTRVGPSVCRGAVVHAPG